MDMFLSNVASPLGDMLLATDSQQVVRVLKGYAWGANRKRWLLEHEKAIAPQRLEPQTALLPGICS